MKQFFELVDQKHIIEVTFTVIPYECLQKQTNVKYELELEISELKSFIKFEKIKELKEFVRNSKNYDFQLNELNDLSINFKWKIVATGFIKYYNKKMFFISKMMKNDEILKYRAKMFGEKSNETNQPKQSSKKINKLDITTREKVMNKRTAKKQSIKIKSGSNSVSQKEKKDEKRANLQNLNSGKTKSIKKLPKIKEVKDSEKVQSLNPHQQLIQIQFQNGDFYTGSVKANKYQGKGKYQTKISGKYDGIWSQGKRNGYGLYKDNQNNEYYGSFVNNLRNGKGQDFYKNGDYYIGEFKNDFRQGKGMYIFANQDIYNGEWKRGMYHGRGQQIIKRKNIRYQGQWRKDKKHGEGTLYNQGRKLKQIWSKGHLIQQAVITKNTI